MSCLNLNLVPFCVPTSKRSKISLLLMIKFFFSNSLHIERCFFFFPFSGIAASYVRYLSMILDFNFSEFFGLYLIV